MEPPFQIPDNYVPKEFVDIGHGLGYNERKNDEYAAIAGLHDTTQIVKMDEQKPIHDTECKHETLVPDPNDTIGDAIFFGCQNPKCGRGWYIRPNTGIPGKK